MSRFVTAICKTTHRCTLCAKTVRVGQRQALDFETQNWVHVYCLKAYITQRSQQTD